MASGNGLPIEQTTWAMLPRKLRILIIVLAAFAVVILCWSGWEFANHMPDHDWIVLAALAIVTFPFCVWLPRTETIVTFGDTYLMAISLIYGPSSCIIATALYACLSLIYALRTANRFLFVFGFSVLVCDALIYSLAFQFIKPTAAHEISAYSMPAVIMALVSFLFTSLIAATAISWRHGNRISALWVRVYLPLLLNSFIAAGAAACIAALYASNKFVPLAVAPAIGFMWGWTRLHGKRLMRKAALEKNP